MTTQDEIAALQAQLDQARARVAELSGGLVAGEKTGFTECLDPTCEEYKVLKEIPVKVDVVEYHFPAGSAFQGIENTTKYVTAVDDSDLTCPACGGGRSVLEERPRAIPKGF